MRFSYVAQVLIFLFYFLLTLPFLKDVSYLPHTGVSILISTINKHNLLRNSFMKIPLFSIL